MDWAGLGGGCINPTSAVSAIRAQLHPLTTTAPNNQHPKLDEVVTEAWHRFLRVSHAHRRSDRRYGSNIPGPLEAHRRLSKRRMGISAFGAGQQAAGGDFGALFGFGGYGGRQFDPQRDLKWKPPGAEKVKKEEHWMFPKSARRKEDIFGTFLAIEEDVDTVAASRIAFDALLGEMRSQTVEKSDLDQTMQFLQSTSDEPEANNILRLCQWMDEKDVTKEAKVAVAHLIAEKVRLRILRDDYLPDILTSLMSSTTRHSPSIINILDAMQHESLQSICGAVTRNLCEVSAFESRPSRNLMNWLYCLRRSSSFRRPNIVDSWRNVHEVLASVFPDPALLADHLCIFTAKAQNLCEILLEHWVPKLLPHTFASRADSKDTTRDNAAQKPNVDAIRNDFRQYCSVRTETRAGRACQWSAEIALLHALQKNGVAYAPFTESIFAILMRDSGAPTLFYRFRELQRHPSISVPKKLAARLLQHFLRSKSIAGFAFALRVFKASPELSLQDCPDLLLRCAGADKLDTSSFWYIMHRQNGGFPRKHPHTAHSKVVSKEYAELVELAALEIAKSPGATPRVAYRRVWEIYMYLRRRRIEITPVMTKAFIVSGILRPLEEYTRPATSRVKYILQLVERVEGTEAAEKLDQVVYVLWTKQVLPVVKQRWRETTARAREDVRSVVGEAETKRWAKYKERLWIRPQKRDRAVGKMVRQRRLLLAQKKWQGAPSTTALSALGVVEVDSPERAEVQNSLATCDKAPSMTGSSPLGAVEVDLPERAELQNPVSPRHEISATKTAPSPANHTFDESIGPGIEALPNALFSSREDALGYSTRSQSKPANEQNASTFLSSTKLRENHQQCPNASAPSVETSTTYQRSPSQPPPSSPSPPAISIDEPFLRHEASRNNNVAVCPTTQKIFILAPSARSDSRSGGEDGELIELEVAAERVRQEAENASLEGRPPTQEELEFKKLVRRGAKKTAVKKESHKRWRARH
ncbi:hypothetical protein CERZMDRAFT_83155 [Cercospora zeae-maydis SCOH1-5]|uniref:Uncharacterized protein n=1 Tax=Cercospora zeae-maydis SCOH1-5 TaxID=717836 RepID=A0A6A6FM49_9PEZI|nr:hypothetical protein CERZMDRAFT_83155 [Cercospora zeae-maydis SCOH1-5]